MDAYQTIVKQLQKKYRIRDDAVEALLDEGDPEKLWVRVCKMRYLLKDSLHMPGDAGRVEAIVVKQCKKNGYRIENIILKDDRNYVIPVNVYVPETGIFPCPAVLVSTGHSLKGKLLPENQILCANLALCGIIAATYDPVCQGERTPYTKRELKQRFGTVPEDMEVVNLHMQPGNLCYLLGENLGGLFVRDSMRVVDYLCGRTDVDSARIGATGQSGGGTQTAYLAALDDRICCYSPIQCLTKQTVILAENGIGDCEQSILGISRGEGFDYADVLWAAFPKPCLVNAARDDFFRLEGVRQLEWEMARLYATAGCRENFSVQVAPCGHWMSEQTRMYAYAFFSRQLLGVPGPSQEVGTAILDEETLACLPRRGFGISAVQAWHPIWEEARKQRPATKKELFRQLQKRYGTAIVPYTVQPLWRESGWQVALLRTFGAREAVCRSLHRDSRALCVAVTAPGEGVRMLEGLQTDVLQILPWGMYSAFTKRKAGYDEEVALFNASAVLGESIIECRLHQIEAAMYRLDKQNHYERVVILGQGPGAGLALLVAARRFPRIASVLLLNAQLSFDALFDVDFYFIQETVIEPGILRLCDLPDLARLVKKVCAVNPFTPSGEPMTPHTATPLPTVWAADGWSAAGEWLRAELHQT